VRDPGRAITRLPARLAGALLGALALLTVWQGALGTAATEAREVRFDGRQVRVPDSWPVYRLAEHPRLCVRLDRRAVYLGTPAVNQRCPAGAVGGRRAILIEPRSAAAARRAALPRAPRRIASASSAAVFTGLGFDACTAPSPSSMAAWKSSPYRAVGVYIGGTNRACSQPALTASWVDTQTAAGWHLIPTYVGLQAPTSACSSCAKLSASQATAQGNAAAIDAVSDASALAMGPGSPIYFDMEAYTQTSSATAATLAFLEAWTEKLHQLGYLSGVYSSSGSGIEDIANQIGTGYNLPDALWIANWNGQANTYDPAVPSNAWASHQRIHQYRGGHNETYGGITINIDNNYLDGPTVGTAAAGDDPVGFLDFAGSPLPGHFRVKGWAFDPNAPTETLSIRVYVGGRAGARGALTHELGPVANRSRGDVAAKYPEAGKRHGFDTTMATLKSGPQPVCAYAVGIAPGGDALLGCRRTTVPVAVTLSQIEQRGSAVRVRVRCAWPRGTECPGQLALRTRFKVAQRRHGRLRIRVVTRSVGRRPFRLTGGGSHTFRIPISGGGRALLRQHGTLRTQLIAAIPGGRRFQALSLRG
jgi:glycoside hydrolase-like protein